MTTHSRLFVGLLLALAACDVGQVDSGDALDGVAAAATQNPARLRLVAANLTSSTGDYEAEGIRILQALRPDVAMLQEFNCDSNSSSALRACVNQAFGTGFEYARGKGDIPNGIVSRYPIVASGEWTDSHVANRTYVWAQIDLPGDKDLWAVSVHFLTTSASDRAKEGAELVAKLKAKVPASDYLVIGGDLNTRTRGEAVFSNLGALVVTSSPYPADRKNNTNTNAGRDRPYDHVLVDKDLKALQVPVVIGSSSFTGGLVADTRVYSPIYELSPAKATDSGASGMQHMAIVKDFALPGDGGGLTLSAPNGGERWVVGSAHAITWKATGVSRVALEYSLDGGGSWTSLATVSASSGSYSWTVPTIGTAAARVRVSDADGAYGSDSSDGSFSLVPTVQVLSPNGGEVLVPGATASVRWAVLGASAVKVEYSANGGASWTVQASSVPADAGVFTWTVPAAATQNGLVRISDGANLASDLSDGVFTIAPATQTAVQVLSPNGGESWAAGSKQTIRWSATGIAAVRVEYSADGGASWVELAASLDASAGSLSWTVPAQATTEGRVRVSEVSGALVDVSDGDFAVTVASGGGRVIVNEILANEPGSTVAGEFVELVNVGDAAVSLAGWTLSDGTLVRHAFAAGATLAPGQALVVFGGASGIPAGLGNAVACSSGSFGLGNSGDTVTVKDAAGVAVDAFTYASSLSGTDGVSMNRAVDGDPSAGFVLHTALGALASSPGTRSDGAGW